LFQRQVKDEGGFDDPTTRSKDNEKKHKIWTLEWTIKKTKVHTPYENNWGG